jgi:hypothetical protein
MRADQIRLAIPVDIRRCDRIREVARARRGGKREGNLRLQLATENKHDSKCDNVFHKKPYFLGKMITVRTTFIPHPDNVNLNFLQIKGFYSSEL